MFTKMFFGLVFGFIYLLGNASLGNAEMFIYPKEGQSKEKQEMDEFQCHKWAIEQTGFDPMNPKQAPAPQSQAQPETQTFFVVGLKELPWVLSVGPLREMLEKEQKSARE